MSLSGYRGYVKKILEENGLKIGDYIQVELEDYVYKGILMPRYELADDKHIVLKLDNGYNIGIRIRDGIILKKISEATPPKYEIPPLSLFKEGLPIVAIIGTGGTIASRIDYRTGAVRPALTAEEICSIVPELTNIASIKAEVLFSIYSEDITIFHWKKMAERINELIKEKVNGIVITHGTDTMGYSAAALSFAIQKPPIPIVFVGSQRSSDRPSSDSAINLISAVKIAAEAPFGEVVVAMHSWHSDDRIAIHRGTKVMKLHTSSRNAFNSINIDPIAYVFQDKIEMNIEDFNPRGNYNEYSYYPNFSDKAALIKFYPNFNPEIIDWFVDKGYKGIILEGTGLGHVSKNSIKNIKKAIEKDVFIGMTSQCIWGTVDMFVYETGRDLLAAGVVPLGDMLPNTALVKLMWVLGQTNDIEKIKEMMLTNIAGEYSDKRGPFKINA